MRGTAQYRRASFLLDAVGKQVLPSFIDIDEDPLDSARARERAVRRRRRRDAKRRVLVERGVLQGLRAVELLGAAPRARDDGQRRRHPQPASCKPTAGTLEDLIKDCDEAFVVGELLGQGVNT